MVILLLTACLMCVTGAENATKANNIITPRFKAVLRQLCPDVSVCQDNVSEVSSSRKFSLTKGPCCTECSCSQNCEETGNCCFPTAKNMDVKTVCVFPSTESLDKDEIIYYQTYSMVSALPGHGSVQQLGSGNKNCGKEIVAPWGKLYPVFSKQNRQIYKNMACANADSVSDGVKWNAYLFCESTDFEKDVLNFLDGFDKGLRCRVDFSYPGNLDDVKSEICYKHLIDTCQPTFFDEPYDLPLSSDEIVQACESGLVSPFRFDGKVYANVFCYVCNGGTMSKDMGCDVVSRVISAKFPSGSFAALLDTRFAFSFGDGVLKDVKQLEMACRSTENGIIDEDNCRPLYCPRGKQRDARGICRFVVKEMYNQAYQIYVKLTADQLIDLDKAFDLSDIHNKTILSVLESPWPVNWEIAEIMYEEGNSNSQSFILLVSLLTKSQKVSSEVFMNNIKYFMKKPWLLKFGNTKLILHSDLMDRNFFMKDSRTQTVSKIEDKNISLNFSIYKRLYLSGYGYFDTFPVTNTLFCKLVELHHFEYVLSGDGSVLLNNLTKNYVHDTEFTIYKNTDGQTRVRVCLHCSGFEKMKISNSNTGSRMTIFSLRVCAYLIILKYLLA